MQNGCLDVVKSLAKQSFESGLHFPHFPILPVELLSCPCDSPPLQDVKSPLPWVAETAMRHGAFARWATDTGKCLVVGKQTVSEEDCAAWSKVTQAIAGGCYRYAMQ